MSVVCVVTQEKEINLKPVKKQTGL